MKTCTWSLVHARECCVGRRTGCFSLTAEEEVVVRTQPQLLRLCTKYFEYALMVFLVTCIIIMLRNVIALCNGIP